MDVSRTIEALVLDCSVIAKWELPDELHPSAPLVLRTFEISHRHNQRIYDCFYVALAERESMPFWTADERLYNALSTHLPFVRFIAHYTPLR